MLVALFYSSVNKKIFIKCTWQYVFSLRRLVLVLKGCDQES